MIFVKVMGYDTDSVFLYVFDFVLQWVVLMFLYWILFQAALKDDS